MRIEDTVFAAPVIVVAVEGYHQYYRGISDNKQKSDFPTHSLFYSIDIPDILYFGLFLLSTLYYG